MSQLIRFAALAAMAVLLCGSMTVAAKTFHVESFGSDDSGGNLTCSKTQPCASITHVLANVAGDRDRIIVGPGTFHGSLIINQSGLKLTSVAGAHATHIIADGSIGITINGDKVGVGQKKKGFSLSGAFGGDDGVYINANNVKFEGNRILGPTTNTAANSENAIEIDGDVVRATIRYNTIVSFNKGIDAASIGSTPQQHNLSDNYLQDIEGRCIMVVSWFALNSRNRIIGNIINGCAELGIRVEGRDGDKSGARINKNIVMNTVATGISMRGGTPQVTNNHVKSTPIGIELSSVASARIKDNLIQDFEFAALYVIGTSPNLEFTGNTMESESTASELVAIYVENATIPEIPFKAFTRNNLLYLDDDACPLAFELALQSQWKLSRNFWGDLADPAPDLSCSPNANAALGTNLMLDPSPKANPIKYKSPF